MASSRLCPHPGCDILVPADQYACREHWYSLSADTRRAVSRAYQAWAAMPGSPGLLRRLRMEQRRAREEWAA